MKTLEFYSEIRKIAQEDQRYSFGAYEFINDAVIFTAEKYEKNKGEDETRHVSGKELLDGVREFALEQFGPMAHEVFLEWGITDGAAVGNIVFNMVEHEILSRSEQDSIDDFRYAFDFKTAFSSPFLPQNNNQAHSPIIA